MPAFIHLSESQVEQGRRVVGDSECNDLLQELRRVTGEDWIVLVTTRYLPKTLRDHLLRRPAWPELNYTLMADCHGEWQMINCVLPEGDSVSRIRSRREAVMNYMLGYLAGLGPERRARAAVEAERDAAPEKDHCLILDCGDKSCYAIELVVACWGAGVFSLDVHCVGYNFTLDPAIVRTAAFSKVPAHERKSR